MLRRAEVNAGDRLRRAVPAPPSWLAVLAAAHILGGCGGAAGIPQAGGAPVATQAPGPAGSAAGRVVPATGEEILKVVRESGARAVLVNVWATWCVPCREEFPSLVRLHKKYQGKGLKVILVSGDFDSELPQVVKFLAEQGVEFTSYIKAGSDLDFINALSPRWSGALPATFIYDARGTLREMWESRATYETFERKVLQILNGQAVQAG